MRGIRPRTILKVMVGLVLFLLSAGSAWALTATDCATCHGADVVEGHHDTVDPNSYYMQGACEQCHVGITTGNDCSSCHQTAGYNNSHHIPPAGQTTLNCASCHRSSTDPTAPPVNPKICSTCHSGDTLPVPIQTYHHTKLSAFRDNTGKLNCTICHPDNTLTNDCQICHADPQDPQKNQVIHHQYADSNNKPCTSCHSQMVPLTGSCQSCHAPRAKMQEHHVFADTYSMNCSFCHTGLAANGTPPQTRPGCQNCHAADSRTLHHDTVMPSRDKTCNDCHTSAAPITGCNSCHTGSTATTHHAGSPNYASGNCGACHTATGLVPTSCDSLTCHPKLITANSTNLMARHHNIDLVEYPEFADANGNVACRDCHAGTMFTFLPPEPDDCLFCHEGIVGTTGLQAKHHGTSTASSGSCATCHSGASTAVSGCAACHGIGAIKPATPETHHAVADANNRACNFCHTGISAPASCAVCHTSTSSGTPESRHHLMKDSQGSLYGCNACHSGSSNIYQSCKGCHENLNGGVPAANYHHDSAAAGNPPVPCATCHTGVNATPLDCAGCHLAPGKPSLVIQHHATQSYINEDCAKCHSATAGNIVCSGCHNGQNAADHHDGFVVVNNQYVPRPCNDCHKVQLAGGSCASCHTAPIPELHHGEPLTAVGGNCGACHQTINDPTTCANCHVSSPHHTTTWSKTGDCAHCHAVPATAADRPAQAACRECHGTTMHDKGGPIQNYGACAACHSTSPFHGDPGIPDGSESRAPTNTGPGRGKFNIFMARNSAQGEQDQWKPRTQITFSTKSISHEGKSYTVPYFTGMSSGNLALKKSATASRSESGYGAALVVDGDVATRWWAKSTSTQWLKVDLGSRVKVGKVALRWHSYYAREYEVRVSTDNSNWTRVVDANYGKGGMEEWTFSGRDVRYIMIYCQRPYSSNGYAVYELEAYAP